MARISDTYKRWVSTAPHCSPLGRAGLYRTAATVMPEAKSPVPSRGTVHVASNWTSEAPRTRPLRLSKRRPPRRTIEQSKAHWHRFRPSVGLECNARECDFRRDPRCRLGEALAERRTCGTKTARRPRRMLRQASVPGVTNDTSGASPLYRTRTTSDRIG